MCVCRCTFPVVAMSGVEFDTLAAQYLTMFPVGKMKLTGVLYDTDIKIEKKSYG